MCNDFYNNTISDATTRCIMQNLAGGTPATALNDFVLFIMSEVLSFILIIGLFSVIMLLAKIFKS